MFIKGITQQILEEEPGNIYIHHKLGLSILVVVQVVC